MMTVPYRIIPSKIHGLGIFAASFIPKGTKVWEYIEPTDYRVSVDIPRDEFSLKYGYIPPKQNYVEFCGDGAIFCNHSSAANLLVDPLDKSTMYAKRDIFEGEEITANYYDFDEDPKTGGELK